MPIGCVFEECSRKFILNIRQFFAKEMGEFISNKEIFIKKKPVYFILCLIINKTVILLNNSVKFAFNKIFILCFSKIF